MSLFTEAATLLRRLEESPAPNLLLMDWHIAEDDTEENTLGLLTKIRASNHRFLSSCSRVSPN